MQFIDLTGTGATIIDQSNVPPELLAILKIEKNHRLRLVEPRSTHGLFKIQPKYSRFPGFEFTVLSKSSSQFSGKLTRYICRYKPANAAVDMHNISCTYIRLQYSMVTMLG